MRIGSLKVRKAETDKQEPKNMLRSGRSTKQDVKPIFPLKLNKMHTTTEATVLPPSFDY
jgi:hypothetical protein